MTNFDDERIRADYASAIEHVRAPERLKAAVIDKARDLRATSNADDAASVHGTESRAADPAFDQAFPEPHAFTMQRDREGKRPRSPRFALRVAAAACAAAVVVGVATVGVLGLPIVAGSTADPAQPTKSENDVRIVNTVQNPNPGANFFTLVAYADESGTSDAEAGTDAGTTIAAVPVKPGEKFALDGAAFDGGSAQSDGGFFDPAIGAWVTDGSIAGVKMILGPVLTGENIETISIEVEGDDAWLERFDYDLGEHGMFTYQKRVDMDGEAFLLNNAMYARNGGDRSGEDLRAMSMEDARSTFQNGYVSVYLGVEASDEARAAGEARKAIERDKTNADGILEWSKFTDEEHDEYQRWAIQEGALMALDTANKLATCTFTATATFSDGTTQTKRFVIEPVEGFYDAYFAYSTAMQEYLDAYNELAIEQNSPEKALALERPASPTLYTITELVEQ